MEKKTKDDVASENKCHKVDHSEGSQPGAWRPRTEIWEPVLPLHSAQMPWSHMMLLKMSWRRDVKWCAFWLGDLESAWIYYLSLSDFRNFTHKSGFLASFRIWHVPGLLSLMWVAAGMHPLGTVPINPLSSDRITAQPFRHPRTLVPHLTKAVPKI